ncbi:MAG: HEAT repeat domain-containing protein [Terriglobales bacterium]
MESVFDRVLLLGPTSSVLGAGLASIAGILLLIVFILLRRSYRAHYFAQRDARVFKIRGHWDDIVSGIVPAAQWRSNPLDREVVETMLLDNIEVASDEDLPRLLACLRVSGLLEKRIAEARTAKGWKREAALVALGRTRAMEAIPALTEGLDAPEVEIRTAALRGLGRTGLPEAALAILDRLSSGQFAVPIAPLKNALLNCCRKRPSILLSYLNASEGGLRELLARVLAEVCTPEMGDELLVLVADPSPEVRASAARALAQTREQFAMPLLSELTMDEIWFVRLRAVVALSAFSHSSTLAPLIRCLCDTNRLVRQRAAAALARPGRPLRSIVEKIVATQDRYALQAFVSELERTGQYQRLLRSVRARRFDPMTPALLDLMQEARQQLCLSEAGEEEGQATPPADVKGEMDKASGGGPQDVRQVN